MATRTPVFYDSTAQDHRPMDAGDQVPGSIIPLSQNSGNQLIMLSDGLYYGGEPGTLKYVDAVNGLDTNPGTKDQPFQTLRGAWNALISLFPDGVYRGNSIVVALRCGQNHVHDADFSIPFNSTITISFYGDSQYGDFNSGMVGGTCNPWNMADLQRPTITPVVSSVGATYRIAGWNLEGGYLGLQGVSVQLPASAPNPSITVVSAYSDYVRSTNGSDRSTVNVTGCIFNRTDELSYWGAFGCHARSSLSVRQFTSQFQVKGNLLVSGQTWAPTYMTSRQYFIKFYPDYAGNNQTDTYLVQTSQTASGGSGLIFMTWTDADALTVTGTKTNQATFPRSFDTGVGLISYIYGVNKSANGSYLNLISSRLI